MMLSRLINQKWDENVANEIFMHDGAGRDLGIFFKVKARDYISKKISCLYDND